MSQRYAVEWRDRGGEWVDTGYQLPEAERYLSRKDEAQRVIDHLHQTDAEVGEPGEYRIRILDNPTEGA